MTVDAHVHTWSLARAECAWPTEAEGVIHRDFLLDDLKRTLRDGAVDGAVLVQTQEADADTDWLLELAEGEEMIFAVVGWVDLHHPRALERIEELATRAKLAGLRPMVQNRPADWYDDPALDPALTRVAELGLVLDALVRVAHLASLDRLAARHPSLRIVIDHAAKPHIAALRGFEEWRSAIAPLSCRPNVQCKISGLLSERGDRPLEAVLPYIEALLALFGPERLMWGSDWPVLEASGDYAGWLALARSAVPKSAWGQLFERTARQFYGVRLAEAA